MVTQTETEQVAKSTKFDLKDAILNRRTMLDALVKAELLEPKERQLAVVKLAVAIWLQSLALRGPTYPAFEAYLLEYFSEKSDVEEYVRRLVVAGSIYDDAKAVHGEYLRGMFGASGKTRSRFYEDMCLELGIHGCLEKVGFGEEASAFFKKVFGTPHEEHLLVAYSVKLFLKAIMARQPSYSASMPDQDQEVLYRYFESSFPLCQKFMKYANDGRFFSSCLDNGVLLEIK